MNQRKLARRLARPARDFLVGLTLLSAVALCCITDSAPAGTGWIASAAHARIVEPEAAVEPFLVPFLGLPAGLEPAAGVSHHLLALASAAVAFATLVAINLWFVRHLRQVQEIGRAHV